MSSAGAWDPDLGPMLAPCYDLRIDPSLGAPPGARCRCLSAIGALFAGNRLEVGLTGDSRAPGKLYDGDSSLATPSVGGLH
jgi:hypothetical protein